LNRGQALPWCLEGRCLLLGGPRFTLAVEQINRRFLLTDGDRTFKPRHQG